MREFSMMDDCKYTPRLHDIIVMKDDDETEEIKCVFLVMEHIATSLLEIIRCHELSSE